MGGWSALLLLLLLLLLLAASPWCICNASAPVIMTLLFPEIVARPPASLPPCIVAAERGGVAAR